MEWTEPMYLPCGSQDLGVPYVDSCLSSPDGRWGYVWCVVATGEVTAKHAPLAVIERVVAYAQTIPVRPSWSS